MLLPLAALLIASFVLAPARLAATASTSDLVDRGQFLSALQSGFVEYWQTAVGDRPPSLERVVDYWFRYHVAKGVLAALVLVTLVALGFVIWRAYPRTTGSGLRRRTAAVAGGAVAGLALLAMVTVMANIQGAVAPFASMLPMVGERSGEPDAGQPLDPVARQLADSLTAGATRPAPLEAIVVEFSRYHAAMALVAAAAAVVLLGLGVLLWRKRSRTARSSPRTRRVLASFGALAAITAMLMLVLAAANAGTASDPAPALLAFLRGGW